MSPALRLAHRGDWRRAPENTIAAFRAALAVPGCDGLEFDVRSARNGIPVVIHDETLDRVQRVPGRVATMTTDEAFLEDAKKMNFDVDPIDGDAVKEALVHASKTPPGLMGRFNALISGH